MTLSDGPLFILASAPQPWLHHWWTAAENDLTTPKRSVYYVIKHFSLIISYL